MRTGDSNDPIDQLYAEHDHAVEQLNLLARSARTLRESGVSPGALAELHTAVRFLDREVREHNEWEENHLFPLLELYTGPGGPCAVMRAEHRQIWDIYHAIGLLLEKTDAGTADTATVEHLAHLADSIVDLLGNHIHKENEILFPMARRMLSPADVKKLALARPAA